MKMNPKPACTPKRKCKRWNTCWCKTCTKNADVKHDYYTPHRQPYYPYYQWYAGTDDGWCSNDGTSADSITTNTMNCSDNYQPLGE